MVSRRIVIAGLLVVAAGVTTAVVAVLGRPSPYLETLRDVQNARERVTYHGVLVLTTFPKESFDTKIRVNHRPDQRVQLRLDGWRRGSGEWKEPRIPSEQRKEMRLPGRRRIFRPVLNAEQTAQNYRIEELPVQIVAGRSARVLDLTPRVAGRRSYRLWIDVRLRVALGMDVKNPEGRLISRWRFESFEEGALDWPGQPKRTPQRMTMDELMQVRPLPMWVPENPPPGYAFRGARVRTRENRVSVLLAYTDGMNVITLIERTRSSDGWKLKQTQSASGKPIVHRWRGRGANVLKVRLGGTYVTVVGSESPEALTSMIESMVEHK